ncbi:MAG: DUF924 domain-containing protein [Candidatus Aenigmarchaeota archaeon]|nr:DUF924 domain-containing protein [Candidatus Aenigmarchaeota archaeon]
MEYNPNDIIKIFLQDWTNRGKAIKIILKSKDILKIYYHTALQNKPQQGKETIKGNLALILIYDQAPRVIFDDNDSKIYDTDKLAREITTEMFENSEYKKLSPLEIMFVFFPYHHSENPEHQKIANQVFKELYEKNPKTFGWIYQSSNDYNKIISKFGRFPHRNKILGRKSTEEEKEFLRQSN